MAEKAKILCASYGAIFIVNDFVQVAKDVDADGLHLGLQDATVSFARQILGRDKIIGGTANTLKDVIQRVEEKCNYVGLGPFRFTETKSKLSPVLGLEKYRAIHLELEKRNISIPVYAIGGIRLDDIDAILESGVYGIAVSALVEKSADPKQVVEQIKKKIYVDA